MPPNRSSPICAASGAAGGEYVIYMAGNLLALLLVPAIRWLGWQTIRDRASYSMLYGLCCTLLMQLVRPLGVTYTPFSASSVLIAVSVGIETIRQIEAQMVMRHHKGFLG
jgi:hypothetical protein